MKEFFRNILLSFYSRPFYSGLARDSKGIGGDFIAAVTIIMLLFMAVPFLTGSSQIRAGIAQMPALASTLPAVTFENGQLSIDKPVPYEINLSGEEGEQVLIVIDTNYKITDVDALAQEMKQRNIVAFVTADKLVTYEKRKSGIKITDLKDTKPFAVTHEDWRVLGEKVAKWGMAALSVFILLSASFGLFFYNFLATVLSGVVVKIFSLILRAGLEFDAALRLAAAARLPVMTITMAPMVVGIPGFKGGLSWLLWLGYLLFATASSKRQEALPT